MAESGAMPVRATKRGDERTPLDGERDVLICGASFAGLAVARELAGSGADVLIVDRYEIGERQTSACGIPTEWLRRLGLMDGRAPALRHAGHAHPPRRRPLPAPLDLLDLRLPRALPAALARLRRHLRDRQGERAGARRRTATGRIAVETDRGTISAPLVVDALGWRRMLANGDGYQPPDAPLSRGLEVHPGGDVRGPRDLDRPPLRPRRLRLVLPGPRRAADRDRLLRPALPRQGHDRAADRGPRQGAERVPGQLDPPQAAPGDRGRRLLRRRLGRPLPAAQRRGDQDRALLRDRARPRAARRRRGAPEPRAGGRRPTPTSTTPTSGSSTGCCGCRS